MTTNSLIYVLASGLAQAMSPNARPPRSLTGCTYTGANQSRTSRSRDSVQVRANHVYTEVQLPVVKHIVSTLLARILTSPYPPGNNAWIPGADQRLHAIPPTR